ncbi:MAG: hypothetical protein ACREMY_19825 [bacterium]
MHVTYGATDLHAQKLKRGLAALGPEFCAFICWWCHGTTLHRFEQCNVCGKGFSEMPLGLLQGDNKPAPSSVVNQVIVAAEREIESEWRPCEACTDPMDCGSWATCHYPQKDFLTTLAGGSGQ